MKVSTDVPFNHNTSGKGEKNTPPHNKANAFEKTCTFSSSEKLDSCVVNMGAEARPLSERPGRNIQLVKRTVARVIGGVAMAMGTTFCLNAPSNDSADSADGTFLVGAVMATFGTLLVGLSPYMFSHHAKGTDEARPHLMNNQVV